MAEGQKKDFIDIIVDGLMKHIEKIVDKIAAMILKKKTEMAAKKQASVVATPISNTPPQYIPTAQNVATTPVAAPPPTDVNSVPNPVPLAPPPPPPPPPPAGPQV